MVLSVLGRFDSVFLFAQLELERFVKDPYVFLEQLKGGEPLFAVVAGVYAHRCRRGLIRVCKVDIWSVCAILYKSTSALALLCRQR